MSNNQQTAAIIIIGNEILSGRTQDQNVQYIATRLSELGLVLSEVRIVRDEEKDIVKALNELRSVNDYVFTTGGLGPTHDDITPASIAKAFGVSLVRDKGVEKMLRERSGLGEDFYVMADAPEGAKWVENETGPGFYIDNVYVMAGVPYIAQDMFAKFESMIIAGQKFISKTILVFSGESVIRDILAEAQKEFSDIQIGSYPFINEEKKWLTKIVVRGQDFGRIINAESKLVTHFMSMNIKYKEVVE